jgi:hypothetical protein
MRIHEFVWPQDRIDHIARHGVTPQEVEQVCFGSPLVQPDDVPQMRAGHGEMDLLA